MIFKNFTLSGKIHCSLLPKPIGGSGSSAPKKWSELPLTSRILLGQCFPKCRCLQPLTLWILHFVLDLTSWLTRCIKFLMYKLYRCPSYEVPALKREAPELFNATKNSVCSFAFMATTYVAR